MVENRFFKYVWYFNGVVIAVAGVFAIALMVFAASQIYKDSTRDRSVQNIVNAQGPDEGDGWVLGQISKVSGSSYIVMPLNSVDKSDPEYFTKPSSSERNYLFIDTESDKRTWLVKHTEFLFLGREATLLEDNFKAGNPTLAFLYELVKVDSNGDGRLTFEDSRVIAFSRPDGTGFTEVVTDVDFLLGIEKSRPGSIFVAYQRDGVSYTASVGLANFELSNESELPKVGL